MGTGDVSKGCSSHLFSCISRFVWQPRKDTIQTTWTPEREVCKQFIYNISDFYSAFGAVFPGIEASSSILQCKFSLFSAKSVHPSVNLPVGPASPNNPGIATNTVIGRNIYRSLVGGSTLYLLATIGDNTTT